MHRKGGLFDGKWFYFGSDNQDNRAQDFSSESIAFTDDPATLEIMKREIALDLADSHPVPMSYMERIQGPLGDIGRIITGWFIEDLL